MSEAENPRELAGPYSIGSDHWAGLSKLIEECGELIQVAGKLLGSGGDTDHWSGDLRQMFVDELGDVQAAIWFFTRHNEIEDNHVLGRAVEKSERFEGWHSASARHPTQEQG